MNEIQKKKLKEFAANTRQMISKAEASGGSLAEIKKEVKLWDEEARNVDVNPAGNGNIIIDGTVLNDTDLRDWILWTQGGFRNRQDNYSREEI